MSETTGRYWVNTPWRSWGVVTGKTRAEAVENAERDRAITIAILERQIENYRNVEFEVETDE